MKSKYIIILSLMSVAILIVFGVLSFDTAESRIVTNVQPDISAEQLRAIVVEDFENRADQGKWSIESIPKMLQNPKNPEDNPVAILDMKFVDGSPSDLVPEKWAGNNKGLQKKICLGVHFKFKYPGYNSVHIIPKETLPLSGRARAVSLWFHGRGNDYTLECWILDYKGHTHILKFGTVNFVGWRPLKAYIPANVPQKFESYPSTRHLKITRFVIRAEPEARTVDTYMFIDQVKVLTDDYEVNFDGQDLHKAFTGSTPKKEGER
jgi:hypothetical protein